MDSARLVFRKRGVGGDVLYWNQQVEQLGILVGTDAGSGAFSIGNDSFYIRDRAFPIQNASFSIRNASFYIGNRAFSIQGASFSIRNASFYIENRAFSIQNGMVFIEKKPYSFGDLIDLER